MTAGQTLTEGVAGARGLSGADGISVSPDGTYVFVTSGTQSTLAVYERLSTGLLQLDQVLRGTPGLSQPTALTTDVVNGANEEFVTTQLGGIVSFSTLPPSTQQPHSLAVQYTSMATLDLTTGAADDTIAMPHAATVTTLNVDAGAGANSVDFEDFSGATSLATGPGNDQVTVRSASSKLAGNPVDLALGGTATQSTTAFGGVASRAIDGNTDGNYGDNSVSHTDSFPNSYWQVLLPKTSAINEVVISNRSDLVSQRLSNFRVSVLRNGVEVFGENYFQGGGSVPAGGVVYVSVPAGIVGDTVKIQLLGFNNDGNGYLSLAEVQVFGNVDLALGGTATQSTTAFGGVASRAIDGDTDGIFNDGSVSHTDNVAGSYWQVALPQPAPIGQVVLYNRADSNALRLSNFRVSVLRNGVEVFGQDYFQGSGSVPLGGVLDVTVPAGIVGDTVKVSLLGANNQLNDYLSLAEVQVFGPPAASLNVNLGDGTNTLRVESASAGDSINASAGTGNDTFQVAGTSISPYASVFLDGSHGASGPSEINTLLFDAGGGPILPGARRPPAARSRRPAVPLAASPTRTSRRSRASSPPRRASRPSPRSPRATPSRSRHGHGGHRRHDRRLLLGPQRRRHLRRRRLHDPQPDVLLGRPRSPRPGASRQRHRLPPRHDDLRDRRRLRELHHQLRRPDRRLHHHPGQRHGGHALHDQLHRDARRLRPGDADRGRLGRRHDDHPPQLRDLGDLYLHQGVPDGHDHGLRLRREHLGPEPGGSAQATIGVVYGSQSASAGGPYTVNQGGAVTLSATALGSPISYQWFVNGQLTNLTGASPTASESYLEAAPFNLSPAASANVTVKVSYGSLGTVTSAATPLTIVNVAPTATFTVANTSKGGADVGTFSSQKDPSAADTKQGFTYLYDFLDNGNFVTLPNGSAIPPDLLSYSGNRTIVGRIEDQNGGYTDNPVTFNVADVAPTITKVGPTQSIAAGAAATIGTVTFSQPGYSTPGHVESYSAAIDWGDGNSGTGTVVVDPSISGQPTTGTITAAVPHVYAAGGSYTVGVTVTDAEGTSSLKATFTINVAAPVVRVNVGPATEINEGGSVALSAVNFTDSSAPTGETVTVNWGDVPNAPATTLPASAVVLPATASGLGTLSASHPFGQPGTYTVTVTVTDAGKGTASNTFSVQVDDVAPTLVAGPDQQGGLGVPVSVGATFSDPSFPVNNASEPFTATVRWNDGTTTTGTVAVVAGSPGVPTTGTITTPIPHQYAGAGDQSVTIQLTDGTLSATPVNVTVHAPAPAVTPAANLGTNPNALVYEGTHVSLSGVTFSDPGFTYGGTSQALTATVDWGDGSPVATDAVLVVTQGHAGVPTTGTLADGHTYEAPGHYTVTIKVTDAAGKVGTATSLANIADAAPTLAALPTPTLAIGVPFTFSETFTDPGLLDVHKATINWGDGHITTIDGSSTYTPPGGSPTPLLVEPTATAPGTIALGHTYTDGAAHLATLTVTDQGGASAFVQQLYQAGKAGNSVALSQLDANSTYGQADAYSATITTTSTTAPSGTVTFEADGVAFGSPITLVNGTAASPTLTGLGAGSHTITAIYSGDASFTTQAGTTTQVVDKAHLTVTASAASMTYGGAVPALSSYSITGFIPNEGPSLVAGTPTLATTATSLSHVGMYPITVNTSAMSASNYDFLAASGALAVNKAQLTVNPANQDIGHGDAIPTLTYGIKGFLNGDTLAVVTGVPTLTTPATSTSAAGHYAITADTSKLSAGDYAFVAGSGTLTVHPKVVDIRARYGSESISLLGLNRDLPFVDITAIDVIFSDDVSVAAGSLSLKGATGASYTFSGSGYNSATRDATWTLPTAIGVDRLLLSLDNTLGSAVDNSIKLFGTASASFAVLPGDFDGDGSVTSACPPRCGPWSPCDACTRRSRPGRRSRAWIASCGCPGSRPTAPGPGPRRSGARREGRGQSPRSSRRRATFGSAGRPSTRAGSPWADNARGRRCGRSSAGRRGCRGGCGRAGRRPRGAGGDRVRRTPIPRRRRHWGRNRG